MEVSSLTRYNSRMSKLLLEIDLAALCRDLEEISGMSASEISEKINANVKAFYRWKSGEREPSGQYTARLFLLRAWIEQKYSVEIPLHFKNDNTPVDERRKKKSDK